MYYEQYQAQVETARRKLQIAQEKTAQAQERLDLAAARGLGTQAEAGDVVQAQTEEEALEKALHAAEMKLAAADKMQSSKEYKQARARSDDLQAGIDKDVKKLLGFLKDAGLTARGIVDNQEQLKHISTEYNQAMSERDALRMQSSKEGNLAYYVLANMIGLFQDITITRPELANDLPKLT